MKKFKVFTLLFLSVLLIGLSSCEDLLEIFDIKKDKNGPDTGYVFTLSNAQEGNQIIAYSRNAKGELQQINTFYPTGGLGSGAGLGSQGALVFQAESNLLFAVNAGSHEVSVLKLAKHGIDLLDIVPSGGERPI